MGGCRKSTPGKKDERGKKKRSSCDPCTTYLPGHSHLYGTYAQPGAAHDRRRRYYYRLKNPVMRKIFLSLVTICFLLRVQSQETVYPAPRQTTTTVITNATV